VPKHFGTRSERAALWNLVLLDGINRDLRILPYLLLRGLAAEASGSLRRALEHLGVLTHIWQTPETVDALEDPTSKTYDRAFKFEKDKTKDEALKAANNSKRFEAMRTGAVATKLYKSLSDFGVHGGTASMFFATSAQPSQMNCSFVQRLDPGGEQFGRHLSLLSNGHRTVCGELICLCVDKGIRTDEVVAAAKSFQVFACPAGEPTVELAQTVMELLEKIGISGSKEIQ
jgi:hypothetical protein